MAKKPIICIVGSSGVGKTFFIEKLVPELKRRGLKIATIKHDIHDRFEMDKPGKDSWRFKKAGASVSIISSPKRIGMVMDVDHDHDPDEISRFLDVDLIIAEGYKRSAHPKIEVTRGKDELICKNDKHLIATVGGKVADLDIPQFEHYEMDNIVDFILKYFDLLEYTHSDSE